MDPLQHLLLLITRSGQPINPERTWFALVPNDPDELVQPRVRLGVKVKIEARDGELVLTDLTTYNR